MKAIRAVAFCFTSSVLACGTRSGTASDPVVDSDGASSGGSGNAAAGGAPSSAAPDAGSGGDSADPELPRALPRPKGKIPSAAYPESTVDLDAEDWQLGLISPTLESEHHNQPHVVNGYLQLTGNARFSTYDISDPTAPKFLSVAKSPDDCKTCGPKGEGEAEGHQVSFAKIGEKLFTVTISGLGIDLWEITDPEHPAHLASVPLEGVNFGDFTEAVWGVYWAGSTLYVGGTNTGLHVIDVTDPEHPSFVTRLPTSQLGNVSAGPVYAVGDTLVVTTPKESGGIATLDISDPHAPFLLDAVTTTKSYIGAFYGHHVYLQTPLRVWDVLSDPLDLGEPLDSLTTENSEYMSFSDGYMFLGMMRPNPGATKIDVKDPENLSISSRIWGRFDLEGNDDQFTIAVGNLLVLSDDQLATDDSGYVGTVIAVHDAEPDTVGPAVDTILPRNGATNVNTKTSIGISFTDNIELATVAENTLRVRVKGGAQVEGRFGLTMGVLTFDPDAALSPNTSYEILLETEGILDYVGNGLSEVFLSEFSTGAM